MHLKTDEKKEFELEKAFLVYGARSSYSRREVGYVSEHNVNINSKGVPTIMKGRALKKDSLMAALRQLARQQGISDLVWVDDQTIATSSTLQVWWTPAQSRWMHFQSQGLQLSLPAQNPPLVWLACGECLMVFALKENIKPGPTTALHHAPLFNVFANAEVCAGSMQKPKDGNAKEWVESFYAATFTHANPPSRRLTTYRQGEKALWKHLMTSKKKPAFPTDKLKPFGKTLGEVVQNLEKDL
ncbi:hypothetical protein Rfer_4407 (plasmid) [Rhodoferax ferrireducens T118]|uniref:PRTRC system protein B n=1 Tax=Albidiferax ferrireducens (strain ATCC BAA-621 / DSM 15236 / T118) TaxID=338969 RepID=Q21Q52_ALBFT|nr:PRTRC system protein B [Rhodoferax ferrireducens]ABD72093.1 hypothetical protein Rfer_4407 [Rhodoferax ferrireducens T118]